MPESLWWIWYLCWDEPHYRDHAYRKAFRVPEEVRQKLRALSFATGLAQTAIIRLSLNQAASLNLPEGPDPDQMELFEDI